MQNENVGPWVKNDEDSQESDDWAARQARDPCENGLRPHPAPAWNTSPAADTRWKSRLHAV